MGQVLKEDFNGEDLNQKIKDNPDSADYFASFMKDYDYSGLELDVLSPQEMLKIGRDHYNGDNGSSRDRDITRKYYQAAAEKGCVDAMLTVAFQYSTASFPFYTKALYWYKKAAELGSAMGKCRAGEMYENGEGVEQDFKEAVRWYEEAGKKENIHSFYNIDGDMEINWISKGLSCAGIIYYHGEEGVPQNRAKAIECFKKAVEGDERDKDNDEDSNYYLGISYLNNDVLEQDYEKAFSCFDIAAAQCHIAALACIDYMFETGKAATNEYKSVAQWYTGTDKHGKAAEQLGYVLAYSSNFISEMSEYHKRNFSALPKESLLYRVVFKNKDGCDRGIFWYEVSADANYDKGFFSLVNLYSYNKENGIERPPTAEKIAFLVNKFYPLDQVTRKIVFNKEDCKALINRLFALAEFARRDGLLFLESKIEEEQNAFIKIGLKLASDGMAFDIIKIVLESLLEIDKKEGIDLQARKIIVQGICSMQQGENPVFIKMKLYEIFGIDLEDLEKEWKLNGSKVDNARNYFERARVYYFRENFDAAIADFQTALGLIEEDDEKKEVREWMRKAYGDKQSAQTFDECFAPYAQLIKKIKSESSKPICEIIKFKTKEGWTELATALALFEEYELLDRLLKESGDSSRLNSCVSPRFCFWEPSPLYFITTKKAWKKMQDPKKMLEYLVKKGADINQAAGDGSTALINQTCYDCESTEVLETLLELGANPNQACIFTDAEQVPLCHCLLPKIEEKKGDDGEIINVLLPFSDFAINQAKLLLKYGADPNLASPDLPGYSPLILAVRYGFPTNDGTKKGNPADDSILEFVKLLIKKGADINFLDSDGNTSLSIAKNNNLSDLEDLLLEHGALLPDELEAPDDDGKHDAWS